MSATAHSPSPDPSAGAEHIGLMLAAEVQDHLLTASNDLDRLQTLLSDACTTLSDSFFSASADIEELTAGVDAMQQVKLHLAKAITALQFQDMASQLITHTHKRLRSCADRLAADAFEPNEDEGSAVIEAPPLRPNPVTQDEMDAGSVELF